MDNEGNSETGCPRKWEKGGVGQCIRWVWPLKARQAAKEHHAAVEKQTAQELANRLNGKTVKLTAKAGANGKLFGSITAKEISEEIKKQFDAEIDKRKISLDTEIKAFGSYTAQAKLHPGINAQLRIEVGEA